MREKYVQITDKNDSSKPGEFDTIKLGKRHFAPVPLQIKPPEED